LYTIRKAHPGHSQALTEFLRGLNWFERMTNEPPEQTAANVARHLEQSLADGSHSIYVAEDQAGKLAGYIAVHWLPCLFLPGPEGFVSELFVRDADRGAGLGSRLLQAVAQEASQRGCYRLSLLNGKYRESYQRRFYEKQGWEERPTMANFVYYMPKIEESP
jgi:GNAT superfamily N-acetyltransferase